MSSVSVAILSGNLSNPSKTLALGNQILRALNKHFATASQVIQLADYAQDFGPARSPDELNPRALEALDRLRSADLLIAVTPVYKGSYTGLFKHVVDFLDPDALKEKPVIIGATGGGEKHALIIEHELRPLFGFFNALTIPTGVYASDKEFDGVGFNNRVVLERIEDAARQAAILVTANPGRSAHSRAA